jgi:GT2 family glycosyltransferase
VLNGRHPADPQATPLGTTRGRQGVVEHWRSGRTPGSGPGWREPGLTRCTSSRPKTGVSLVLCTYQRPDSVKRFLDSVSAQTRPIDELIVVDASRDRATEVEVAMWRGSRDVAYWRVDDPLRGLTRQRNFALETVAYDLTAFFDDDVVLDPGCIAEMERAHRASPGLAGVGCFAETPIPPTRLWRLRRALRIVPHLRPGSYTRTGMSVPWRFHEPTNQVIDGDWLPGCAMLLKTEAARQVRFDEALAGYGQGEDLDFSLRLRDKGRIAMVGAAHCEHLHESAGRPNAFTLGHMEIRNRHLIWRRVYRRPRVLDRLSFGYAWTLDTILLVRDAVRPRYAANGVQRIAGRLIGASHVLTNRPNA